MPVMQSYKNGQFSWVDLSSHDMAAIQTFYGGLFGWECRVEDTQGGPPYAMFWLGEHNVGGLGEMNEEMKSQGIPPMWNSYITVTDIEATIAKAESMGATVTVPVMQVFDAGKLAFFIDPTGASVALWEAGVHHGAGLVNDPGAFCWNELATRDADGAAEFFKKLLGWDLEPNPNAPTKYHIAKVDGRYNAGILQMNEQWEGVPPHWTVYFTVTDVDASSNQVGELGGKIHHGPFDTSVGRIAVVQDPQGAMFNLIQLKGDHPD